MVIRKELNNHMRVVMEPMEQFTSVSIGVWVDAGSANENPDNNGIAHVAEHMLFKGTATRSARDIADETAALGDHLDAYTSKECTCYCIKTLGEYADKALEIIADMICHPKLDPQDLKKELGVILDEIDMYEDDADELVHELLQKKIWQDHPLGYIISGEKDVVRHFDTDVLRRFMNTYYNGRHLLISVAGRFDPETMLAAIKKQFGDIPAGAPAAPVLPPVYHQTLVCRHKDIEQMHFDLAFDGIPYEHEDKYVLGVVNSILGGNGNSRLFQEVREEKGLAYTVYSYGSSFKQCGLFQIYAAMAPEQTAQVLDAVLASVERMRKEAVSERELSLTKRQIQTELLMSAESTHNRMEANAKAWLYNEHQETLQETAAHVAAVTAEDVSAFMQKYLRMERLCAAFVGNLPAMDADAVNAVFKKWGIPLKVQ